MQLLLDSAILDEARHASGWGWVSGATTNPNLLAKSNTPPAETLKEMRELFDGPIFYQLTGKSIKEMAREAKLAEDILADQLVLKIPATDLGFRATAELSTRYTIAVTSLYTPAQALVAYAAGAKYALYYHNRAKRLLPEGAALANELMKVLAGTDTVVVAASLKSVEEVIEARMAGVPILSAPLKVLSEFPLNEHSEDAVADFDKNGTGLLDKHQKESK